MNVRSRLMRVLAPALSIAIVAGCGVGSKGSDSANRTTTTTATGTTPNAPAGTPASADLRTEADRVDTWTVFVYLAADNDLEAAAITDLQEMAETEQTRYLVLLDRTPGYSDADVGGLGDFEHAALIDIQPGAFDIEPLGEINQGDPAVLADFIATGFDRAPDGHHALVIWDHGGSWHGAAWDDTDEDRLEVAEIARGLADGLEAAGRDSFDLIGFDACLMGTYEVARALAPHAAYLLASEEIEPGTGWDWTAADTGAEGATTQDLAGSIIDGFVAQNLSDRRTDITLSLIDLVEIEALDAAVDAATDAIAGDGRSVVGRIGYSRVTATSFGRSPEPAQDYWLVDLGDLATELGAIAGMEDAAAGLADAVERVVVHTGSGPAASRASGIAAYFPTSATHLDGRYHPLELAPAWMNLLDTYYRVAAEVPEDELPFYTVADRYIEEDRVDQTEDWLDVAGDVTPGTGGNIINASLRWGRVNMDDTSEVIWFGERNAGLQGDTVSGRYDWTYLTVLAGDVEASVYADEHYAPDGSLQQVRVPIRFARGAENLPGQILIDVVDGEIYWRFYLRAGDRFAEVPPEPGDLFVPLLADQDLDTGEITWIDSVDAMIDAAPAGGLGFEYRRTPSAEPVMVGLEFEDLRGGVDAMYYGTAST